MVMSVGVIGIEGADPWLLDALLDPGQSDLVVAGCWSPPRAGTGGCNGDRRNIQHVESLDELIAAADCLYIGTPVALRLPFACRAITQHKAVFCEQPLAKDPAETSHFVREAQNARVAVNYVTPSVPAVTHLRNWLKWRHRRAVSPQPGAGPHRPGSGASLPLQWRLARVRAIERSHA
jgi:predicted dehydrogenase